jgi:hypothetical protein
MTTYVLAGLFALWVLASLKTSRSDGTMIGVPEFRRLMFFIMPGRNESVVYFDRFIRAEALEAYVAESRVKLQADMTHALVAAAGIGLAENPRMNQFTVGRRMYARKGRWVTFSMKRQAMNKQAKLSAVKREIPDGQTFAELVAGINSEIRAERSGEMTAADKEFQIFNVLPRPLLYFAASAIRWLDYYNLMPAFFIKGDGMYTSIFIANLGSVGMSPGYHHLYEYGTCPLFIMVGKVEERPVVENGEIKVGRVLHLRFSYDERIADGLTARFGIESVARVLEDPARWLGCIRDDKSDVRPMFPHGENVDLGDDSPALI